MAGDGRGPSLCARFSKDRRELFSTPRRNPPSDALVLVFAAYQYAAYFKRCSAHQPGVVAADKEESAH